MLLPGQTDRETNQCEQKHNLRGSGNKFTVKTNALKIYAR